LHHNKTIPTLWNFFLTRVLIKTQETMYVTADDKKFDEAKNDLLGENFL